MEHPKTSHKLSKTIRQAEKIFQVGSVKKVSDSPLYSQTKKAKTFSSKKKKERKKERISKKTSTCF